MLPCLCCIATSLGLPTVDLSPVRFLLFLKKYKASIHKAPKPGTGRNYDLPLTGLRRTSLKLGQTSYEAVAVAAVVTAYAVA